MSLLASWLRSAMCSRVYFLNSQLLFRSESMVDRSEVQLVQVRPQATFWLHYV